MFSSNSFFLHPEQLWEVAIWSGRIAGVLTYIFLGAALHQADIYPVEKKYKYQYLFHCRIKEVWRGVEF